MSKLVFSDVKQNTSYVKVLKKYFNAKIYISSRYSSKKLMWAPVQTFQERNQDIYSQHCIFFLTYEGAQ
jgi:hypothetical protein